MTAQEAQQRALNLYAAGCRGLLVMGDRGHYSAHGTWVYIVIHRGSGTVMAA